MCIFHFIRRNDYNNRELCRDCWRSYYNLLSFVLGTKRWLETDDLRACGFHGNVRLMSVGDCSVNLSRSRTHVIGATVSSCWISQRNKLRTISQCTRMSIIAMSSSNSRHGQNRNGGSMLKRFVFKDPIADQRTFQQTTSSYNKPARGKEKTNREGICMPFNHTFTGTSCHVICRQSRPIRFPTNHCSITTDP